MKKWKQYGIIIPPAGKTKFPDGGPVSAPAESVEALPTDSPSFEQEGGLAIWSYLVIFLFGGVYYCFLEALWRGYTHWTMAITGGACFLGLFLISVKGRGRPILLLCLEGSLLITALELLAGSIVNLLLGWNVWDYASLPFHFMGQICLLYSIIWFFLCIPGIRLCRIFYELLSGDTYTGKGSDLYETQIR